MSIATELQNYNDGLLDAYTAVNTKGGTVPEAKNLDNLNTAIASIPAGGGTPDVDKDIRFYDYDGTLVEAWTLAELQEKTELPANPTHAGLTALGWNWTLADLKTENARMTVGQMYEPTDGGIHMFLKVFPEHLSINVGLYINGTINIDWGDGSAVETATGTNTTVLTPHTYAAAGDYHIIVTKETGTSVSLDGDSNGSKLILNDTGTTAGSPLYRAGLKELWLPSGTGIYSNSLAKLGIERIVLNGTIEGYNYFLCDCDVLCGVTIPSGWTGFGNRMLGAAMECKFVSFPHSLTGIEAYFGQSTRCDYEINIPSSVTYIGNYFLANHTSYKHKIVFPSSITSIGTAFINANTTILELEVNTSHPPSDSTSLVSSAVMPCFVEGVTLTGTQVSAWMTALPNVYANNNARRLIDGTV